MVTWSAPVKIVTGACGLLLMAAGVVVAFRTDSWSGPRAWGYVVFVVGFLMTLALAFLDRPRGKR